MSMYLTIRKDGIDIIECSRCHPLVGAIEPPYSEKFIEFSISDIEYAINETTKMIQSCTKRIDKYTKLLNTKLTLDEKLELTSSITQEEDWIDEQNEVLGFLKTLEFMMTCDEYRETKPKWEWQYC